MLLVLLDMHGHGADTEPLGRQAAFFGAVHALALRLRSVFVPYYRYVMDGALAHLSSAAAAADAQPKKKRKKSSLPAADAPSSPDDPNGLRWVVRHRVRTPIHHPHKLLEALVTVGQGHYSHSAVRGSVQLIGGLSRANALRVVCAGPAGAQGAAGLLPV